jgi:hypothetical protein
LFGLAIISPRLLLELTLAVSTYRAEQLFIHESVSSSSGDREKRRQPKLIS